jgi:hypothetical protein
MILKCGGKLRMSELFFPGIVLLNSSVFNYFGGAKETGIAIKLGANFSRKE